MRISLALGLLVISFSAAPPARSQQNVLEPSDPVLASEEKAIQQGRTADAQKILSDAINQAKKEDANSPRLASYLELLANLLARKGVASEALPLYQSALQINQDAFGPKDERVEQDLYLIGRTLAGQRDKRSDAEQYLKRALDVIHLNPDIPSDAYVWIVRPLAGLYTDEGRFGEAEQLLLDAQRTCANSSGDSRCGLSFEFSRLYRAEGRIPEAEQAEYGSSAVDNLNLEAGRYEDNGAYEQAAKAYSDAIALLEKSDASKFSLANEYGDLAIAFREMGRYDEAGNAFLKEIGLEEQDARSFNPQAGLRDMAGHTGFDVLYFDQLLMVYRHEGRLTDAEPVIQHAIDLQEELLGPNDPSLAQTLVALANLYQEEGNSDKTKYVQALPLYERALDIRQTALGPDDWRLTEIFGPYADLLGKLHQDAKAATVRVRIRALEHR